VRGGNAGLTYLKMPKRFVGVFHDRVWCAKEYRELRGEKQMPKPGFFFHAFAYVTPTPPKGNISKCNKQRT